MDTIGRYGAEVLQSVGDDGVLMQSAIEELLQLVGDDGMLMQSAIKELLQLVGG